MRKVLQLIASACPSPVNAWIHRLYGARIGKNTKIQPGVLILAKEVEIGDQTRMRFGTVIKARSFKVGRKCLLGYFLLVKGVDDLKTGDACVIGPKTMINCDRAVTLGYYCGIGPCCSVFTHGSLLPVTEGYRTMFAPVTLEDKAWVTLSNTIGPGVTIGAGSVTLPGSVLLEDVAAGQIMSGDPASSKSVPNFLKMRRVRDMAEFGRKALSEYCEWSNEYEETSLSVEVNGELAIPWRKRTILLTVDTEEGDIVLYTESGKRRNGMFFNIPDLSTDKSLHPVKMALDDWLRLEYGLTFLSDEPTRRRQSKEAKSVDALELVELKQEEASGTNI